MGVELVEFEACMKKVLFIVMSGLFLSSCTNDSYDNSVDRLYRVAHKTRLDGNSEIAATEVAL